MDINVDLRQDEDEGNRLSEETAQQHHKKHLLTARLAHTMDVGKISNPFGMKLIS